MTCDQCNIEIDERGEGLAGYVGVGYGIPLSAAAAITPYVTWLTTLEVAAELNGGGVALPTNVNPNILQAGLTPTVR